MFSRLILLFVSIFVAVIFSHRIAAQSIQTPSNTNDAGYVFGVTVRTTQELDVILERADQLRSVFDPDQHSRIAIVLHGDELQLFQKNNYSANQSLVERARLLDQDNIIDIKACQTQMRYLDIEESDLPSFIEQVPYAPAEIERLKSEEGFTRL